MTAFDTDCYHFGRHAMFKALATAERSTHSKNIIEVKDDLMFGWDATNMSVLSLNWRAAYTFAEENVKHQVFCGHRFSIDYFLRKHNLNFAQLFCEGKGKQKYIPLHLEHIYGDDLYKSILLTLSSYMIYSC